jgi:predicted nucleic acid-binding protein
VAFLVDTNVLVYRHDPRFPAKQKAARDLLRRGVESGEARLPHQAVVELVAATTRPAHPDGSPRLAPAEAREQAERLLAEVDVIYPDEGLVRLALRGAAAYGLSWFDAYRGQPVRRPRRAVTAAVLATTPAGSAAARARTAA